MFVAHPQYMFIKVNFIELCRSTIEYYNNEVNIIEHENQCIYARVCVRAGARAETITSFEVSINVETHLIIEFMNWLRASCILYEVDDVCI